MNQTIKRPQADASRSGKVNETLESEQSPRVLFVIDSRFPGLGGAEHQAVKLAQGLHERGIHVEYLAPMVVEGLSSDETIDGIRLRRIAYPHVKYLGSIFVMIKFAIFILKHRREFDVMHIHITRLLTTVAGLLRPITGLPILTKISGFFEFEGGVLDNRKRWHPLNFLMRLAMKNVDYVQTISLETRDKLLAAGFRESQIVLIPNGIDTSDEPEPKPQNKSFTIGYCGRLREVKGVHVLLDGFAKCKEIRPDLDIRLKLAGDGVYEEVLRKQAKTLGIESEVDFLGVVVETKSFYSSLDLYVQPSFAEGLPNSVIEAMNAALAVVATDIGGNRDLIQEGVSGHFFAAGDAATLAELLVKCALDQAGNIEMGANGRQTIVEQFGMKKVTGQLLDVYRGQ